MAIIVDLTDRTISIFRETFEARSAPDDQIHYAIATTLMPDESDGLPAPCLSVFISVGTSYDLHATTCSIQVPYRVLSGDEVISEIANTVWDRIQGKRMSSEIEGLNLDSIADE